MDIKNNQFYTVERSQQILIALLKKHGIKKVIASPGTANMTLVLSMQHDGFFEMYSSVDERSAAYMACGLSGESGEPVVIACTEATASRNYMSGLTEAFYRKLPVVAITGNHGENKIGNLCAQVIDRRSIPNDVSMVSVNIPRCKDIQDEQKVTLDINKALLGLKHHGGGPVHINIETTNTNDFSVKKLPEVRSIDRITVLSNLPKLPKGRIGIFVGAHKKWSEQETRAVEDFCKSNNAVVFCDHTSNYKGKYAIHYALIGTQESYVTDINKMDLLIRIGEVSGEYYSYGLRGKEEWRVSEDGELRDFNGTLTKEFEMSEKDFFSSYITENVNEEYYHACTEAYNEIFCKISEEKIPFSNIWIASIASKIIPDNSALHVGILQSLRAYNYFSLPANVNFNCNVGGFGIDGCMSTLIGASLVNSQKTYFGVFGDLSFFYDMNVLGNHHIGTNVRIMLINNGRGQEFRNYTHPAAIFGNDADKFVAAGGHFGNMSKKLVHDYAIDLGFEYLSASNKEEFNSVCAHFFSEEQKDKSIILEVFTDTQSENDAHSLFRHLVNNKKMVDDIKEKLKGALSDNMKSQIKKIIKKS